MFEMLNGSQALLLLVGGVNLTFWVFICCWKVCRMSTLLNCMHRFRGESHCEDFVHVNLNSVNNEIAINQTTLISVLHSEDQPPSYEVVTKFPTLFTPPVPQNVCPNCESNVNESKDQSEPKTRIISLRRNLSSSSLLSIAEARGRKGSDFPV